MQIYKAILGATKVSLSSDLFAHCSYLFLNLHGKIECIFRCIDVE